MHPNDLLYLGHIEERILRIKEFARIGMSEFLRSPLHQDAVIRNFEVIGEAAKRLSDAVRNDDSVKWRELTAFRNFLIHQYEGVDLSLLWSIIENDLPPLERAVRTLLEGRCEG